MLEPFLNTDELGYRVCYCRWAFWLFEYCAQNGLKSALASYHACCTLIVQGERWSNMIRRTRIPLRSLVLEPSVILLLSQYMRNNRPRIVAFRTMVRVNEKGAS